MIAVIGISLVLVLLGVLACFGMAKTHFGEGYTINLAAFGTTYSTTIDLVDNIKSLQIAGELVITTAATASTKTAGAGSLGILGYALASATFSSSAKSKNFSLSPYGLILAHMAGSGGRLPRIGGASGMSANATAYTRKFVLDIPLGWNKSEQKIFVQWTTGAYATVESANTSTFTSGRVTFRPRYGDWPISSSYLELAGTLSTAEAIFGISRTGLLRGIAYTTLDADSTTTGTPDSDICSRLELKTGETSLAVLDELGGVGDMVVTEGMFGSTMAGVLSAAGAAPIEPYDPNCGFLALDDIGIDPSLTKLNCTGTAAGRLLAVCHIVQVKDSMAVSSTPAVSATFEALQPTNISIITPEKGVMTVPSAQALHFTRPKLD